MLYLVTTGCNNCFIVHVCWDSKCTDCFFKVVVYILYLFETGKAGKNAGCGGNPVCVRPTPEWQKGIDGFITKTPKGKGSDNDDVSDKVATENVEDVNMDECAAVAKSSWWDSIHNTNTSHLSMWNFSIFLVFSSVFIFFYFACLANHTCEIADSNNGE